MAYPILAASSTWYSQGGTTIKRSSFTKITIVNSYLPTGEESESWDADADKNGTIKCYIKGSELILAGNGSGKISANINSSRIFSSASTDDRFNNVTRIVGIDTLDTTGVTSLAYAFTGMSSLELLDISSFTMSSVYNAVEMFSGCSAITQMIGVGQMDMSSAVIINNIFLNCSSLTSIDIHDWNIPKITTLVGIFSGCSAATEINVSTLNVSNVKAFSAMFKNCSSLTSLNFDGWNTSKVTSMESMFEGCASLSNPPVENFDTSSVTNMKRMFSGCFNITSDLQIGGWDVSKVAYMNGMFSCGNAYGEAYATNLATLDIENWDVSSCINMAEMFYGQKGLQALYLGKWNMTNVESLHHTFAHCRSLVIYGTENWGLSNAKTLNAAFHGVANRTFDVSKWNSINCESFSQTFENCEMLNSIAGLELLDTSKTKSFVEMFNNCSRLEKLDLSNFDTSNADASFVDPSNKDPGGMTNMFNGMSKLKEIKLGSKFSFTGNGSCPPALLPTQTFEGATGKWYSSDCRVFDASEIPSNIALSYYAVPSENPTLMFIKYGTLYNIAEAIREKTKKDITLKPAKILEELRGIQSIIEPYIEETYDVNGNLISATIHGYTKIRANLFNDCVNLNMDRLPDGITIIGSTAFRNCIKITLSSLPSSLSEIHPNAFTNCKSLTVSSIPSGVAKIENGTFYRCSSLKSMEFHANITEIANIAFSECTILESVTFKGTPNVIASDAFSNCPKLTIINVPWAEGEVANAPWGATNATINYNYVPEEGQ